MMLSGVASAQVSHEDAVSRVLSGQEISGSPGVSESAFSPESMWQVQPGSEMSGSGRFYAHQGELSSRGLVVDWEILSGNYLYQEQFGVSFDGSLEDEVRWGIEEGTPYQDEFFGDVMIYRHGASMLVPFEEVASRPDEVTLAFQGCSDQGVCFPPERISLALDWSQATEGGRYASLLDEVSFMEEHAASGDLSSRLGTLSLGWLVGGFLLLGLGLSLTPCVLPMVPVVSAMIMGSERRAARGMTLTSMYVLGMVSVYAAMGWLVAMLGAGSSFQAWMRHPAVVIGFALLIALAGLITMGAIRLRDGGVSQRVAGWQDRLPTGHPLGAYVLGVSATLILSPCVTGPLAGVLLYIATTGDVVRGTLSLASLALGMGIPLLLIGVLGRRALPRPGKWMDYVKRLMGWVLIGVAVWLAGEVLPDIAWLGLVFVMLVMAVEDWWRWHRQHHPLSRPVIGAVVVAAIAVWLVLVYRSVDVSVYEYPVVSEQAALLEKVEESEGDLLVKVTADWCMICQSMERAIFQNPSVMEAYDGEVVFFDVTALSEDQREMMASHGLFGPPALLHYRDGELRDQRSGGLSAGDFQAWLGLDTLNQ